ncbi:corticoliberin [Tamandua tetradactyla]|uniref:corticoliberin n=1 Tax=Tamandua tetradactyla TaxID=48850 RepID=UPI00405381C3
MRLPLLMSAGVLLVALLPCPPCRASLSRAPTRGASQAPPQPGQPQQQPLPILLRMGEEYFRRLRSLNKRSAPALSPASSPLAAGSSSRPTPEEAVANFFRELLPRHTFYSQAGLAERRAENAPGDHEEAQEMDRRSEESPISLDLTFHLLREVLEIAMAEELAQQAHSNRKLMEIAGK